MTTLTILLHGLSGSPANMQPIADRLPGRTLCLRAPLPWGSGFSWFDWRIGIDEPTVDDASTSVEQVVAIIQKERRHGDHVVAIGWSQGATVILEAMRMAPTVIDRAILAAGFPVPGSRPTDSELRKLRPPVVWIRGEDDDVIPQREIIDLDRFLAEHTQLECVVLPLVGHELEGPVTDEIVRRF